MICAEKGISMVEVLIAIFLTAVGVLALLALQPTGWRTMAKADYMGRAAGILFNTLEDTQNKILNPCYSVTVGTTTNDSVYPSGQSTLQSGDVKYNVTTTISQDGANPRSFLVTVTVTWPPINMRGVSASMTVRRQDAFKWPPNNC